MIRMANNHYRYRPDSGEVPEGMPVLCGVCGSSTTEVRGVRGPRSMAEMFMGSGDPQSFSEYDDFCCPFHEEHWHMQVWSLRESAMACPSVMIARMLMEEADQVLLDRVPTRIPSEDTTNTWIDV